MTSLQVNKIETYKRYILSSTEMAMYSYVTSTF